MTKITIWLLYKILACDSKNRHSYENSLELMTECLT